VAAWIAAPAPKTIAWVAMVMIAVPIIIPASQEPPGGGGGELPVFLRRCISDVPLSNDFIVSGRIARLSPLDVRRLHLLSDICPIHTYVSNIFVPDTKLSGAEGCSAEGRMVRPAASFDRILA
jgi:hypothetical protein